MRLTAAPHTEIGPSSLPHALTSSPSTPSASASPSSPSSLSSSSSPSSSSGDKVASSSAPRPFVATALAIVRRTAPVLRWRNRPGVRAPMCRPGAHTAGLRRLASPVATAAPAAHAGTLNCTLGRRPRADSDASAAPPEGTVSLPHVGGEVASAGSTDAPLLSTAPLGLAATREEVEDDEPLRRKPLGEEAPRLSGARAVARASLIRVCSQSPVAPAKRFMDCPVRLKRIDGLTVIPPRLIGDDGCSAALVSASAERWSVLCSRFILSRSQRWMRAARLCVHHWTFRPPGVSPATISRSAMAASALPTCDTHASRSQPAAHSATAHLQCIGPEAVGSSASSPRTTACRPRP